MFLPFCVASNRHFFRQTPNHYLALYFDAKGVEVDADITKLSENHSDVLQGIINQLDDNKTASLKIAIPAASGGEYNPQRFNSLNCR